MKVLITGHTGFKGAWLSSLLSSQGMNLIGFSDTFNTRSLYARAGLSSIFAEEAFGDVADFSALDEFVKRQRPDVVIHLAAQPLVSEGYLKPLETFQTNILGTTNVIWSALNRDVSRMLVITSDKVYAPALSGNFNEGSPLGGIDPYSASKSAADIVADSLAKSFGGDSNRIIIARAGNVIGGGDHNLNRIMVDLFQAWSNQIPLKLRNPNQVRPWQHVLDCSAAYLKLILTKNPPPKINIGPEDGQELSVEQLVQLAQKSGLASLTWESDGKAIGKETDYLTLDVSAARGFGIANSLTQAEAIAWTVEWHLREKEVGARRALTSQIEEFSKWI